MRLSILLFATVILIASSCSNSSESSDETSTEASPQPKTFEEKLSYSLGIIASSSVMGKLEESKLMHLILPEKIAKGINDFVAGKEIEIDPAKAKENLSKFFRKLQEEGVPGEMQQKDREILSYSIGVDAIREIYGQITDTGIDTIIDLKIVLNGMNDYILQKKIHINVDDSKKMIQEFFQKAQASQKAKTLKQFESVKIEGEKFLEENKRKKGIKVTQSGLQVETIREGKGVQPKLGDTVEVHYTGTFIDGKKFDSSLDRKEPYVFIVDYNYPVISGWVEGALNMKQGGKYKIYLPSDLGYKDALDKPIPPYSVLVFEIEILSVNEVKGK